MTIGLGHYLTVAAMLFTLLAAMRRASLIQSPVPVQRAGAVGWVRSARLPETKLADVSARNPTSRALFAEPIT
jgi:hypothetical protein